MNGHMTFIQRAIDDASTRRLYNLQLTSMKRLDVNVTLFKRHVLAGTVTEYLELPLTSLNVRFPLILLLTVYDTFCNRYHSDNIKEFYILLFVPAF